MTQIRERPILFSAPMVRAILDGRKTQTRRVVKAEIPSWVKVWNGHNGAEHFFFDREEDDEAGMHWPPYDEKGLLCPYGQPGDRLWVRESFSYYSHREGCWYWADGNIAAHDCERPIRPSIHMPRWASRITLEVVSVRVERLQDISEQDAKAEGAEPAECCHAHYHGFRKLWESINGAGSWEANPWVWVVEFRRVQL